MTELYLGIGGNIGDRIKNLKSAIKLISKKIGSPTAISSIYISEPWGFKDKNYFLNIVAKVDTRLMPQQILSIIKEIEKELKREKHYKSRYEARSIDIDILFFGNKEILADDLVIPHPKICERLFVLLPLQEIAPDFNHYIVNKNISQLVYECEDNGKIRKLAKSFREKII